ncbi:hypothetical protein K1T71_002854 [Dendrolimus kikuchii]|uniref:Uncharacterized protein n=1 Tax=Dendrolimus kikuchii TaxID=765133 RepID=A0ACC1DE12_9NEOP|nr:hypothetical protein K1T71_002854 [Dendrolimus kikuchii]
MLLLTTLLALSGLVTSSRVNNTPKYYYLKDAIYHFDTFKNKHGKIYPDVEEETKRLEIFKGNLQRINYLNDLENDTVHGLTMFVDLTDEEFTSIHACFVNPLDSGSCEEVTDVQDSGAPEEFDWRDYNAVTEVKNQGHCGSCWAFGSTGALEGAYALKYKELTAFSEKQLMDCDKDANGCDGGNMADAFSYLMSAGGAMTEQDYPYQPAVGSCKFDAGKVKARVTQCYTFNLQGDEEKLKQLLHARGPITIGVNSVPMRTYDGTSVLKICDPYMINHSVLLVGYGTDNGTPYWLIKNSWGLNYGIGGYIKILRGNNVCGLMNPSMAIPVVA